MWQQFALPYPHHVTGVEESEEEHKEEQEEKDEEEVWVKAPMHLDQDGEATTVEDKGELFSYQLELIHAVKSGCCIQFQRPLMGQGFQIWGIFVLGLSAHI